MKIITLILSLFTAATLGAQPVNVDLKPFTKLKVGGSFKVEIVEGDHEADVIAENCSVDDIEFEHVGSTLKISFKKSANYSNKKKATITLKTQKLSSVDGSASAHIHSQHNWEADSFHADASSASKIELTVATSELDVDASSGANIKIAGTTDDLSVDCSSGSKINLKKCVAQNVKIDASSGSSVSVDPQESLKVDASSGSSIKYTQRPYGSKISKSSGASVKKIK